jgi:hypothetical protein
LGNRFTLLVMVRVGREQPIFNQEKINRPGNENVTCRRGMDIIGEINSQVFYPFKPHFPAKFVTFGHDIEKIETFPVFSFFSSFLHVLGKEVFTAGKLRISYGKGVVARIYFLRTIG